MTTEFRSPAMTLDEARRSTDLEVKSQSEAWSKRRARVGRVTFGYVPDRSFNYWSEASFCYIHGFFNGCIVLSGIAVEIALKHVLEEKLGRKLKDFCLMETIANQMNLVSRESLEKIGWVRKHRNMYVHSDIDKIIQSIGSSIEIPNKAPKAPRQK